MHLDDDDMAAVLDYICEFLPTYEQQQAAVYAIETLQADFGLTEKEACDLVFSEILKHQPAHTLH